MIASLLETWDCASKITQNRWADSAAEKKRLRDLIEPLHDRFRADVVLPYLAAWRQYVYRLSMALLIKARDRASAERRRVNALNYGDLLNLTARVLRDNPQVRQALQQKYKYLLVDEFQDTDPVQAEILFWLAEDIGTTAAAEEVLTGARSHCVQARSSLLAIPNNRFTGFDELTSISTTSFANGSKMQQSAASSP